MSNDHSDPHDTNAPAKIDIGEEVDEFASTITLNRQDIVGSLRASSSDEDEVDEEAEPRKVTPHLGEEVDPSEGTLTLDAAAIKAALAKDNE